MHSKVTLSLKPSGLNTKVDSTLDINNLWKSSMELSIPFSFSLVDQVKSHHCKSSIGILYAARSHRIKYWKELDSRITDAANEAKDNVKYLSTLDKLFIPLTKCTPVSLRADRWRRGFGGLNPPSSKYSFYYKKTLFYRNTVSQP